MTAIALEDADVASSADAYARRFAGAVGTWFLDVQTRITLDLLRPFPAASVLDVGGGHGQLAAPVAAAGHAVTVLGSAPACAHRVQALVEQERAAFASGDLMKAPFPDRSFDVVLAFRMLAHVRDWPGFVAELCRLARHAVIVDYPARRSANAVAERLFALKQGVEKDTRPFRVLGDGELAAAFSTAGFHAAVRRPQFFVPMAVHRGLGVAPLSRAAEALAGMLGLVRGFGSPVILRADRRG